MWNGRRRRLVVIGVVCALLVFAAGVVSNRHTVQRWFFGDRPPQPVASAQLGGSAPGSLLGAETMPNLDVGLLGPGVRAARVVYRSTEGEDNVPVVVTGAVFTPKGDAPQGGWPVIAVGHPTTGINEPCAPSLSNSLLGSLPQVELITGLGFAVALPDYGGLGAPGIHRYLDSRTAGFAMIDAVRALRSTFPNVSKRWAAFGTSQGGGAAWAAAEYAGEYAPELDMVGAVAVVPAADITGIVDLAAAKKLTDEQVPLFQWLLASIARIYPNFDIDAFRRGVAAENWELLTACSGSAARERAAVARKVRPADLAPDTGAVADELRTILQRWELPQRRLSAPLSVVYGARDAYIDPAWTAHAIERACELGGSVIWREDPESGHTNTDASDQVRWVTERFAGDPAPSHCVRPVR